MKPDYFDGMIKFTHNQKSGIKMYENFITGLGSRLHQSERERKKCRNEQAFLGGIQSNIIHL